MVDEQHIYVASGPPLLSEASLSLYRQRRQTKKDSQVVRHLCPLDGQSGRTVHVLSGQMTRDDQDKKDVHVTK